MTEIEERRGASKPEATVKTRMPRVTDDVVRQFLIWGRNYGEIESYEQVAERGRKWRIRLKAPATAKGKHDLLSAMLPEQLVPVEFTLTNREALAFGYGLAVAGSCEAREQFAEREWGWE